MKSWHITLSLVLVLGLLMASAIVACSKPAPTQAPAKTSAPAPAKTTVAPAKTTAAPAKTTAATKPIELKFSYFGPPTGYYQDKIMKPFIKDLQDKSAGKVKIDLHTGGTLAGSEQAYEATVKGIVDIAFVAIGSTPGRFRLTQICELPFGSTNAKVGTLVLRDLYKSSLSQEFAETHVLYPFTTGAWYCYTTKKQIQKLEDFKGLRLRFLGAVSKKLLELFGAVPTSVVVAEMYTSLERGLLDGLVHSYLSVDSWGVGDLLNYGTATRAPLGSYGLMHTMNLKAWNSLPEDTKKVFTQVSEEWLTKTYAIYDDADTQVTNAWGKHGYKVVDIPTDEAERWRKTGMPVWDDVVKNLDTQGMPGTKVLQEFQTLLKKYGGQ